MKQPCGCCAGIENVTPQSEANRPGLPALVYRAGTYATFLESMLARISSIYLDVPTPDGKGKQRIFPLNGLVLEGGKFKRVSAGLSTRELNDPSIALFDAWATVVTCLRFTRSASRTRVTCEPRSSVYRFWNWLGWLDTSCGQEFPPASISRSL